MYSTCTCIHTCHHACIHLRTYSHVHVYSHIHVHTDGGIDELVDEMSGGKVLYAFLQVTDPNTKLPKNVLVNWVSGYATYM